MITIKKSEYAKKLFIGNSFFIVFTLVAFVLIYVYIGLTAKNAIYMDRVRLYANSLESILDNTFSIKDAFTIHAGHLGVGTYILLWIDISILKLNAIWFCYLIPIIILVMDLIFYWVIKKTIENDLVANIMGALISLTLFSLLQWEIVLFSYGIVIYIGNVLFLVSFLLLCQYINSREKSYLIATVLLTIFNVIFFGGGYSFAYLGAAFFIVLLLFIIKFKEINCKEKIIFSSLMGFFLVTTIVLYVVVNKHSDGAVKVSSSVGELIVFYLKSLASVFISSEYHWNGGLVVFIGVVVLAIYLYAVWQFFSSKLYEKTYLPIALLAFSQLVHFTITFSRIGYSADFGMSSRYYASYLFGFIGIIWILGYGMTIDKKTLCLKMGMLILVAVLGMSFQVVSYEKEFRVGKYRRLIYEEMISKSTSYSELTDDDLAILYQDDAANVRKCFEILEKRNLYTFKDVYFQTTSDFNTTDKLYGFIGDGDTVWISDRCGFLIKAESSKAIIKLYNPNDFPSNSVVIKIDKVEVLSGEVMPGELKTFEFDVSLGYHRVDIYLDHYIVPSMVGPSTDERKLGLIVNYVMFKEE